MRSTAWAEHSLGVVGHQMPGRVGPVVLFPVRAAILGPSCGSRQAGKGMGGGTGGKCVAAADPRAGARALKLAGAAPDPLRPPAAVSPSRTRAPPPPPTGTIKRSLGSTADFDYGQFGPVLYKGPNAHAARATRRIWWPRPTWSRCRVCPAPAPSPSCPRPAGRPPTRPSGRYRRGGHPRRSRRRRHG